MLIFAAIAVGTFAFSVVMWATGTTALQAAAAQRLAGMRGEVITTSAGTALGMRRRAAVQLGGLTLVPAKYAAKWDVQLERAGLTLHAREYFILRMTVAATAAAIGMMLLANILFAVIIGGVGYYVTGFWLKRRITKRTQKLEAQLVDLLQMISSGLKAGFGLVQALDSASQQAKAPMQIEVKRALRDTAMGASIEQSLGALNDRIGSPDFDIVVTAILIQRSVGGNLGEILENVGHTMRERERIRGEIRTLTSQQRMTGYVVGGIPIGLLGIFFLISPEFIGLLFTTSMGHIMLGVAAALEVLGFFVIKKIVDIEV